MSFNRSNNDSCINITVSVPHASFYRNTPDFNGNTQVVPDNEYRFPSFEEHAVPQQHQFDAVETESFYKDFFDCAKTPEAPKFTQQYHISSAGELKRLKNAAESKKLEEKFKKRSPWRLIIEEEDVITSSPITPVHKKPQSAFKNYGFEKDSDAFLRFLYKSGWTTGILPGQEYLDDLYEIARSRNDPMLLESLESFLSATVDNLLQKQSDNEKLDTALKRATEKNSEIAVELEQEMEQQVAMLEEKIRHEEQRKLDQQKYEANKQIGAAQSELLAMEQKVKELENKVEKNTQEPSISDSVIDEIKLKDKENEVLQKKLIEFQTQMALMRTEVAQMKAEYDEQADRLMNERGTVLNCVEEQESLTRQLHLLHEANKKLHDTNDDLRSALDSQRSNSIIQSSSPIKRSSSMGFTQRRPHELYSSFRSDPGAYRANSSNKDFDDTDEDSMHSLLPHDEDVNEQSLMTELLAADHQKYESPTVNSPSQMNKTYTPENSAFLDASVSDRDHFVKQLDVLCVTNKRLGESNDELRQALSVLSEQLRNGPRVEPAGAQSAPVTPLKKYPDLMERPQSTSSPRKVLLTKSGYHSLSVSRSMPDLSTSLDGNSSLINESESKEDDESITTTQAESFTQADEDNNTCQCGKKLESKETYCQTCIDNDTDEITCEETESLYSAPSHTIYSETSTRPCECEETKENCDICTQVNDNTSLDPLKYDKSIQCEFEMDLGESQESEINKTVHRSFSHNCQPGLCTCEEQYTDNPMEKSTQISDMQLLQTMEDIIPIEIQDDLSIDELVAKLHELPSSPNGVYTHKNDDNNNNIDDSINQPINQLAESTILTDSDSSNNYSDQETPPEEFTNKRVKPVGESDEDATYETGFGLTDSNWISDLNSSYTLLQNLETELSMFSRRQADEEIDEDDMDDEELVRLVDQTNDEEQSIEQITDELITVEEKVLEPRGFAVGADTSSESVSRSGSDIGNGSYDRMFKIVLAGDAAVGKSSFIIRLCKDKFYSALNSTLGVDFQLKTMNVDEETVALQLWDTAGQERFRSIAKSYFRRVDGVILLYDVTCENSFLDVRDWLESIESSSAKRIPVIICGNKIDLRAQSIERGMPVVSREQGKKLADDVGALFLETSAKDGTNINKACRELARQLQTVNDESTIQDGITLEPTKPKKSGCCRS